MVIEVLIIRAKERSEIMEAIRKLKVGKVPGLDGITAEMLKYGRELVVDWMM